ncbi:hypothetical protein J3F84DRAFT_319795 [Trichoderma pleuroticola]
MSYCGYKSSVPDEMLPRLWDFFVERRRTIMYFDGAVDERALRVHRLRVLGCHNLILPCRDTRVSLLVLLGGESFALWFRPLPRPLSTFDGSDRSPFPPGCIALHPVPRYAGDFTNYNGLKITSFGEELASEKRSLPTVYLRHMGQGQVWTVKVCGCGSGGGFRLKLRTSVQVTSGEVTEMEQQNEMIMSSPRITKFLPLSLKEGIIRSICGCTGRQPFALLHK